MRGKNIGRGLIALFLGFGASGVRAQDFVFLDMGAQSINDETETKATIGNTAIIFLDVTTITTPDADDEIDIYIQTTYTGGISWTDIENIHFSTTDDGNTAQKIIVIDGATDGPGAEQSITGTNPAAGAEISETVPANTIWRLNSFAAALVSDATAPVRTFSIVFDDGTTTLVPLTAGTTQAASLTRNYILDTAGVQRTAAGTEIYLPISTNLVLPAGYRLVTTTTNLVIGDDYGAPQLSVDAWHDPSITSDATMGDNLKSYGRPLGSFIRIKIAVTGATAPTYRFTARGRFVPPAIR